MRDLVIYELHVGTFTPEGTFEAAIPHLRELAELGVTAIEIMPVAEFPGRHDWGYDGVYISAAHSAYGGPHGLARLVAAAHDAGLAVILDVVYNHVGASGTQALDRSGRTSPTGTRRRGERRSTTTTPTATRSANGSCRARSGGSATSGSTACDSTRSTRSSTRAPSTSWPRWRGASTLREQDALVIAESGLNDPGSCATAPSVAGVATAPGPTTSTTRSARSSPASATVLRGLRAVAKLAKAWHRPYVYDGNYSGFRRHRYGAPADDVPPERFVVFSQNHDQVGNRAFGDRLPPRARPLAAFCTLLSPYVPMLFMGEEYGEHAPFQFFSDHIDEAIAQATREGRREEFASFAQFSKEQIPDPQDRATFERSKLSRHRDPELTALYAELLRARRRLSPGDVDAIEFDEDARWLRVRRGAFELVMNFAPELRRVPCSGESVVLATATGAEVVTDGHVELDAMSGALIT